MQEEFLHYLWKHKNFSHRDLRTMDGQPVSIIIAGEYNTNAGPDFLNAQLMIGDTFWAGHVEIHVKTSDWTAHKHSVNPAYDNVILHVVYQHDTEADHHPALPVLALQAYVSDDILNNYEKLKSSLTAIPCEYFISSVDDFSMSMWLERMLVEKLEDKAEQIIDYLKRNNNDWAETCYQLLARSFGFHVNAEAFEKLSLSLPLKLLTKHAENLFQLEALIFGQAGFLAADPEDDYGSKLQKEYRFLATKYQLTSIRLTEWKFLRLRPENFPTVRLAQFAAFMTKADRLFSKFLALKDTAEVFDFLEATASPYWDSHFRFYVPTDHFMTKKIGKSAKELLTINTLAPLLFAYGQSKGQPRYKEKAIDILESLKPEKNHILSMWESLGISNKDARQSQALLHLKKQYCDARRCLDCGIGTKILRPASRFSQKAAS